MKNFGEKEAWAYPGTAQFFLGLPYYIRNGKSYVFQIWPVYSECPSEQKPTKKIFRKGSVDVSKECQCFWVPPIIPGTAKAAIFKFCTHIYIGSIGTKAHYKFLKSSRGYSQGLPKIFRAPIHMAHHAVIFATAQLSC